MVLLGKINSDIVQRLNRLGQPAVGLSGEDGAMFDVQPVAESDVVGFVGRIEPRPVVRDGEIVVRRTGTISLSFDHRVVAGARAAGFGLAVIARLQSGRSAPA